MKKSNLLVSALLLTVGFASGALAVTTFSDVAGHWAEKSIMWASTEGLVMGDAGKTTFRPNDGVTRAELVTVMQRYDVRAMEKMTEMEAEIMKMMDPNYFPIADADYYKNHVGASTRYVCESAVDGSRIYTHTDIVSPFAKHYYDASGNSISQVETKNCQATTIEFYNSKVNN